MSRHDSRAVEAALYLCVVLLALMLVCSVTGCANAPMGLHSWGGEWPWAEPRDGCTDFCSI